MIWLFRLIDRLFYRRQPMDMTPEQLRIYLSIKSRRGIFKERL